jgi:hypothetical protein
MFDANVFNQNVADQGTVTIVDRENGAMSVNAEHIAVG